MKLKTITFTILSILVFFIVGHCAFAYDFEENFESYPDGYAMDNEPSWTCPNWVVETEEVLAQSIPNSLWKPNGINDDLILNLGGQATYGSFYNRNHGVAPIDYKYFDTASSQTVESFKITHQISFSLRFILQTNHGSTYLDAETGYDHKHIEWESDGTNVRIRYQDGLWSDWVQMNYGLPDKMYIDIPDTYATHLFYDDIVFNYALTGLHITSPQMGEAVIKDSWITVQGVCPTDGTNQIAFTNDCSDFSNLNYTVDCVGGTFADQFYYNGISDWVVAVDKNSVAGDCVDYDDLMDGVDVWGIEVIEGYPDDWFFNFNYYNDYDIKINYPVFNTALTLPLGSTSKTFSFNFVYPSPLAPNLTFKILQYDNDGNLLNGNYHSINLIDMPNTSDYQVEINASGTANIHYVVQLFKDTDLVRQYPFMVAVSDLDIIINSSEFKYLFPRLVEELKTKVVFNYYFAFYDGFYNMFNASTTSVAEDAMDITFKSVSGNGEYNTDIQIFSASDPIVKSFSDGIRPWVVALLWLLFALYVVFRITHLFSDND